MGSTERLCLRWNDFETNIKHGFSELREEEEFFDVTLACGSKQIKAHKVILSACSPFFRSIIKSVPHEHPLLYLRGIQFNHLESLLSFMYNGEVNVTQEELNNFLAVAEELKIKGLTQNHPPPPPPPPPPPSSHHIIPHHHHHHIHNSSSSAAAAAAAASSSSSSVVSGGTPVGGGGVEGNEGGSGTPSAVKRPRLNKVLNQSSPSGGSVVSHLHHHQSPSNPNNRSRVGGGPGGLTGSSSSSSRPPPPSVSSSSSSSSSQGQGQPGGHQPGSEDDDIEDITPVKSEPKDNSQNTMVVTPDVTLAPDDLGEDAYAGEDENYDEYAQYGSESGDMTYAEGGQLMEPAMAVPGPSGGPATADGNKGLLEELEREIDTFVMDDTPGISSCRKCGYSTTVRSRLRRHIEARHVTTRGFICDFCGFVSKTRHSLREHVRHRHAKSKC